MFSVENASGATVFSAPIGADLGRGAPAIRTSTPWTSAQVTAAGTYTITVAGRSPRPRRASASTPARACTPARWPTRCPSTRPSATDRTSSPIALRTAPAHLHDQNAMTYLTPNANSSGHFTGDLTPLGVTIDASGGWWDAGDYLKFVQTTSYTADLLLLGVRDFPSQMGAGIDHVNFTAEAKFGADWLLRMWDDRHASTALLPGRDRRRERQDPRRPRHLAAAAGRRHLRRHRSARTATSATARSSGPGPPGSPISPNLAGPRRRGAGRWPSRSSRPATRPSRTSACSSAEHIFDLANTAPSGNLLTVIPFSFYPETEWRDDLELGAIELYFAMASGRPRRPDCRTPIRCSTSSRRPTGPTRTSPGRTTPPTP